jgi:hypothetical protein
VEFDFDPVGVVVRSFIDEHVSARDQKELRFALVEESGCVGQRLILLDRPDSRSREQQWFNQRGRLVVAQSA